MSTGTASEDLRTVGEGSHDWREPATGRPDLYRFVHGAGMELSGMLGKRGHQLRFVTDEHRFGLESAIARRIRSLVQGTVVECTLAAANRRRIGVTIRVFRTPAASGAAIVSISESTLPNLARFGWPSDRLRLVCVIGPGRLSGRGQRLRITWQPGREGVMH